MSKKVPTAEIQKKLLEILLYFESFCKEHGLHYVLAGGTCLGAVRHKGFIPWDDDLDVFMLREDYEKLQGLWEQYADQEHYACVRSDEKINIHHSATEIKDNHTTFINRHSVMLDINHGLMIDVLPIDAVAEGRFARLVQMVNSMLFCCFNFQRLPEHKGKITYYVTKVALSLIRSPKTRYRIWKHCEKQFSKYPVQPDGLVASLVEGATIMRQRFPAKWFLEPAMLEFEGHMEPVPQNYDAWLAVSYGDYMQYPPEEERIPRHNAAFIDLEHGYPMYRGKEYCINH